MVSPRVNNLHTHDSVKPYVRSKGRKFEKARGRRRSNGFKVIMSTVTPKVQATLVPPFILRYRPLSLLCTLDAPFFSSLTF